MIEDELQKRNFVLFRARKKYIPSRTRSITEALELYLRYDAEKDEQIPLIITKKTKPKNWVDQLGRPKCPNCETDMGLRIINEPKGQSNIRGYKTCWECSKCGFEEYRYESVQELISKKRAEGETNGNRS